MVDYPDFFESGYKYKWDKDVYHFLLNVASEDPEGRERGLCHRVVRAIVSIWNVKDKEELRKYDRRHSRRSCRELRWREEPAQDPEDQGHGA